MFTYQSGNKLGISGPCFHIWLCQGPPWCSTWQESLGLNRLLSHSALKPGESELGAWGKGRKGRENLAPASHPQCHSWVLIKEENIGSDILYLQDPNVSWLFRSTKGSGFTETILLRTFDSKPKLLSFLVVECTANAMAKWHLMAVNCTTAWGQPSDGSWLLSNGIWKREVMHRNLSNSSKNFVSLKWFNIFLYVLGPKLSKSWWSMNKCTSKTKNWILNSNVFI